jgi:hypothetical protein
MRKTLPLMLAMILFLLSGCDEKKSTTPKPVDDPQIIEPDPIELSNPEKKTIGVLYLDFTGKAPAPLDQVWVEDHTPIVIDEVLDTGIFLGSGVGVMTCEDDSYSGVCTALTTYETRWEAAIEFIPDTCVILIDFSGMWWDGEFCATCEVTGTICEPMPEVEWDTIEVKMEYLYEPEVRYVTRDNVEWEYMLYFEEFEFDESRIPEAFTKNCELFID